MSKKNKSVPSEKEAFQVKYPVDFPQVSNMDDIGYMLDEAINDKVNRLENERNKLLEMKLDPRQWEVEIAYFRREQQMRKIRYDRHQTYLQKFSHVYEDQGFDTSSIANHSELN